MTKQILLVIYIAVVLAISGSVKADSFGQGLVSDADLNAQSGILSVHGVLPNPCALKPVLTVNQIDQTQHVISLEVVTTVHGDYCIEMLGGTFDATLDLKELPLIVGETYSIVIEKMINGRSPLTYVAKAPEASLKDYRLDRRELKGYLVAVSDPMNGALQTLSLTSGSGQMQVVSPDMNLSKFINSTVYVEGYVIRTASLNSGDDALTQNDRTQTVIIPVEVSR